MVAGAYNFMQSNFRKIFCYFNDLEKIRSKEAKYFYILSCFKQILLYSITALPFLIFDKTIGKSKLKTQNESRDRCLFVGGYSPDLVISSKDFLTPIIATGGIKDSIFSIKNNIQYFSDNNILTLIAIIYIIPFFALKEILTSVLLRNIEIFLIKVSPKWILLVNDVSPLEKAFITSSRKLRIQVITIQHGWNSEYSKELDYKDSDYYIVWGEHFKNMYLKKRLQNSKNIFVLGYPYIISDKYKTKKNKEVKKVCFFGQPFLKINGLLFKKQIEIVNNIVSVSKILNLDFCYRLHPGENKFKKNMQKLFPNINFVGGIRSKEDLLSTIDSNDLFISINSTALIEAAGLYGKFCIQIYDPAFNSEKFEDLGICYTINNNLEEIFLVIKEYVNGNKTHMKFNNDIIKIPNNLGKEFYTILSKIDCREQLLKYSTI